MDKTRRNYNSIDLMKLLMMLVVAAIHTDPLFNCYDWRVQYVFAYLKLLAVPFYFIATGFLMGIRGGSQDAVKLRLIKTIKSYLIASLAYLPLAVAYYKFECKSIGFSIVHYIRGLLLIGEHFNSWILWYLLAAIFGLAIILFCNKMGWDKRKYLSILIVIGLAGSILLDELGATSAELPSVLQLIKKILSVTLEDGRLFRGLIFIPMGMLIADFSSNLKQKGFLQRFSFLGFFILGLVLIITLYKTAFVNIAISICSFGLFGTIINIELKDSPVYGYLRTVSTAIYFCHMWVWTIYYYFRYTHFLAIPRQGLDSYLVSVFGSIIIGTIWYFVLRMKKNKKM